MNYNNVLNNARKYCMERSLQYHKEYTGSGVSFYRYLVLDDLLYGIDTLIDVDFQNLSECKNKLLSFTGNFQNDSLTHLPNKLAEKLVSNEILSFTEYVGSLQANCEDISLPYSRRIVGEEREEIELLYLSKWEYYGHYWYPMINKASVEILFIMKQYLEKYAVEIEKMVLEPEEHVYEYGESFSRGLKEPFVLYEIGELSILESGEEVAYTDKSASWIIYISHEQTVTFAGSILPQIKSILKDEQEHWNHFVLY